MNTVKNVDRWKIGQAIKNFLYRITSNNSRGIINFLPFLLCEQSSEEKKKFFFKDSSLIFRLQWF